MDAKEFLVLAAQDPQAAADHLDQAADNLKQFATELRAAQPTEAGAFTGGMMDRVRMRVVSQSGQITQCIDTQEQR